MHVYVGFNAAYSDRELWLLYDMEIRKKKDITCRCQTETVVVGLLFFLCNQALISYDAEL